MNVQLELWHLILLLIAFIGAAWAGFGVLLRQVDKRLDARFEAMESARRDAQKHWDRQFGDLAEANRREADGWQRLERDFLGWKAELPIQYVRREDYVRNQTVIEAKLDGLALRIENQFLKGNQRV